MAKLVYSALCSLDGYFEDATGRFDWAAPDDEVHAFVNELARPLGTYLYGRRMYETMVVWETANNIGDAHVSADYARIWQAAEKFVYSRTLSTASSARTHIRSEFDADAIRRMKLSSTADIAVAGGDLAGHAIRAGLVDEIHLLISPVSIGGGKSVLPRAASLNLNLIDDRHFANGVVHLHYQVTG